MHVLHLAIAASIEKFKDPILETVAKQIVKNLDLKGRLRKGTVQ